MLTKPMTKVMIPDEMTTCHMDLPSDFSDVAFLLRLPRVSEPSTSMVKPRVTKPEEGERSGQLREM